MGEKIKSSGALTNISGATLLGHIELLNVDPDDHRHVTLIVLDWGTTPIQSGPVAALLNFVGTIPPNTRRGFNFNVPVGVNYEVRISYEGDDFSINTFATTVGGTAWLEGYTVRNDEFFKIELD
jgi:hypothetical protein